MEKFNLLYEPWILVMVDDNATIKEVSLIDLFQNSHKYKCLAGETPAQDFAILRFLLAVLHTVFSRFDSHGNIYDGIELDDKYLQINEIEEDEVEDYSQAVYDTWKDLWEQKQFPNIIIDYLKKWEDRFNLYDEKYPFYQVTDSDLKSKNITNSGEINLKLVNRLISESNNKASLFSPFSDINKNKLSNAEISRWLIAFQAYTGTADKAKYPKMEASASKGWLLGLGCVYLSGASVLETLLLNMIIIPCSLRQTPIWERSFEKKVDVLLGAMAYNLAELYTNWSRLLIINAEDNLPQKIRAVQLPSINPQEFFLEQMTMWVVSKNGPNKNHYIPKTHYVDRSFWRSFGQVSLANDATKNHRRPGIIDWHNHLVKNGFIHNNKVKIVSIGLSYNTDASTMLNDEIYDELNIYDEVLADTNDTGWVFRINSEIELIKTVVEKVFGKFVYDIKDIRNLSSDGFKNTAIQDLYYEIDLPFRKWLSNIKLNDNKEDTIISWRLKLLKLTIAQAQKLLEAGGSRDFIGRIISEKYINIEIAYNSFMSNLNKELPVERRKPDERNHV